MMRAVLAIVLSSIYLLASCRDVGTVIGRNYNDILKTWVDQEINIYTCHDKHSYYRYYINVPMVTPSRVALSEKERIRLIKALKKAVKWAQKAHKNHVPSFTKLLFRNWNRQDDENILNIYFFTANKGQQNDIIIRTVDFDNMFEKGEAYLDYTKIYLLIHFLEKAKKEYEKARKADRLAKEFR